MDCSWPHCLSLRRSTLLTLLSDGDAQQDSYKFIQSFARLDTLNKCGVRHVFVDEVGSWWANALWCCCHTAAVCRIAYQAASRSSVSSYFRLCSIEDKRDFMSGLWGGRTWARAGPQTTFESPERGFCRLRAVAECLHTLRQDSKVVEYVATSSKLCENDVRHETHTVPVRKGSCTVEIQKGPDIHPGLAHVRE